MSDFEFIAAEKENHTVAHLCTALDVSESGFYAQVERSPSARKQQDQELGQLIEVDFINSRKTYGSPRIHAGLAERGHRVSRKRVIRLMREKGLDARPKHSCVNTTDSNHRRGYFDHVLQRDFSVDAPNQVWVGDMTYIRTDEGWLYLATMIDLFARRVVGWAIDDSMPDTLPLAALQRALNFRGPVDGLIHHTDRGSQYASNDYKNRAKEEGIIQSMSRKADCWDNAVAESFFASLEKDVLMRHPFSTKNQARKKIIDYIENFYNPIRKHSYNQQQSPIQAENQYFRQQSMRHTA